MSEAIVPNYPNALADRPNITLCELAEPRLMNALAKGGFILVNGLVVKTNGLVAAVAPGPIEAEGGVIEPGAFYLIYDDSKDRRSEEGLILEAFLSGEVELDLPGTTKWFMARPVRRPAERLAKAVNEAVAQLRNEGRPYLPDRESRLEFRRQAREQEFPE